MVAPGPGRTVFVDECGDPAGLLVDFLNTVDVEEGTDVLASRESWAAWAREHGLPHELRGESLASVRRLRDALRARAGGGESSESAPVTVLAEGGRVRLGGSTARAVIAAAVAQTHVEGRLDRVKLCPAHDCGWAFLDTSRNHSRQWCDMSVCGNRAKVRTHRERSAGRS